MDPADDRPNPARLNLNYSDRYRCPLCQHGTLSSLVLMDVFACDFCRHMFTANLENQVLRVEDSLQNLAWRWNGQRWLGIGQGDGDLSGIMWFFCLGLMIFPALLVGLPMLIFEPLPGSAASWFPQFWFVATLLVHLGLGGWPLMEYHQFSPYIAAKTRFRIWRSRFPAP
jgi:ribosomal protein L37AE/L43A